MRNDHKQPVLQIHGDKPLDQTLLVIHLHKWTYTSWSYFEWSSWSYMLHTRLTIGLTKTLISSRFPTIHFSSMDSVIDIIHENYWTIPPQLPLHLKDYMLQSTRNILIADDSSPDTLSWIDSSFGNLSLKATWHLLRTHATDLPWTGLIWNKYMNPPVSLFLLASSP